jgi:hypothetical protein
LADDPEDYGCGHESLKAGESVIASGVLEISAELDAVKARSAEEQTAQK